MREKSSSDEPAGVLLSTPSTSLVFLSLRSTTKPPQATKSYSSRESTVQHFFTGSETGVFGVFDVAIYSYFSEKMVIVK
jgi:hypothetical protein